MSRAESKRASDSLGMKIMAFFLAGLAVYTWRDRGWSGWNVYALFCAYVALLVVMDWWRTRKSKNRWRGLVCAQVGHSLPERSHAWTKADAPVERVECRRCGRAFEAPRICGECGQVRNEEETP